MMRERIITFGVVQDAGTMTAHMHPEGGIFEDIGDQEVGKPCVWCERGVPLYGAVKRIVENEMAWVVDAETGAQLVPPYPVGA